MTDFTVTLVVSYDGTEEGLANIIEPNLRDAGVDVLEHNVESIHVGTSDIPRKADGSVDLSSPLLTPANAPVQLGQDLVDHLVHLLVNPGPHRHDLDLRFDALDLLRACGYVYQTGYEFRLVGSDVVVGRGGIAAAGRDKAFWDNLKSPVPEMTITAEGMNALFCEVQKSRDPSEPPYLDIKTRPQPTTGEVSENPPPAPPTEPSEPL